MVAKWFDYFILMVLENTGWTDMQNCQFVKYIQQKGIVFSNWSGVTHPSGPNYRAMLSGQIWSDNEFDGVNRENIAKYVPYSVYSYRGSPAERHNPFHDMNPDSYTGVIFFNNNTSILPITYLGLDDSNNAHSGPLSVADQNVMGAINFYESLKLDRSLFFVTTDEGFGHDYGSNHVFTGMFGPSVPIKTITSSLNHYNLAQWLYDNWGVSLPPEADQSADRYKGQNLMDLK